MSVLFFPRFFLRRRRKGDGDVGSLICIIQQVGNLPSLLFDHIHWFIFIRHANNFSLLCSRLKLESGLLETDSEADV